MNEAFKMPVPTLCPFDSHILATTQSADRITTTCTDCGTQMHFDPDAPLVELDAWGEANVICRTFIAVEGIEPDDAFDWVEWVKALHTAGYCIARRPASAPAAEDK